MTKTPDCLKIFFMKFQSPSDHEPLPVIISVRAETAYLLAEMAKDMDVTIGEVLSSIAEDAVTELERPTFNKNESNIPISCSTADLLKILESR